VFDDSIKKRENRLKAIILLEYHPFPRGNQLKNLIFVYLFMPTITRLDLNMFYQSERNK